MDAWAQHPGPRTPKAECPQVTVARLDWDTVTAPQLAAFQPDVVLAAGTAQLPAGTRAVDAAWREEWWDLGCMGLQGDRTAQGVPPGCPKAAAAPSETEATRPTMRMVRPVEEPALPSKV